MWRPGRRGKCPRTFAFDVVATALPHSGTASDHAGPLTLLCWLAAAPSRAFCRLWTFGREVPAAAPVPRSRNPACLPVELVPCVPLWRPVHQVEPGRRGLAVLRLLQL